MRERYKGWGPWKQQWFSICSRHGYYDPKCDLCTTGHWTPVISHKASSFVYNRWPDLWRAWMNRK